MAIDPQARSERALELFKEGYNCAQSIALAFSDLLEIDSKTLSTIACSFGGGMGQLREVCGAITGAFVVMGLLYGYDGPETGAVKKEHYQRIQDVAKAFEEKNGTIICRELLQLDARPEKAQPAERNDAYYHKRHACIDSIRDVAVILSEFINAQE